MTVHPRHKAFFDELVATGEVIEAGPFADRGNLASDSVHEWMV